MTAETSNPATLETRVAKVCGQVDVTASWWQQFQQYSGIVERVFRAPPLIYDFFAVRRQLPQLLTDIEQAQMSGYYNPDSYVLNALRKNDIYRLDLAGTTPADIEKMPLPLRPQDIRRIDLMFGVSKVSNHPTNEQNLTLVAMIMLATQKSAHKEKKVTVHDSVRPLYDRLTAYFDFYASGIINPSESLFSLFRRAHYFKSFKRGGLWVFDGVCAYLPGKLDGTPASAVELITERVAELKGYLDYLGPLGQFVYFRNFGVFLKRMEKQTANLLPKRLD